VSATHAAVGFCAAFLIALVTTPVGVSGAVFLLPVQLSVLGVPNPAVTPTNLLYNVVATPGALLRYAQRNQLASPLTRRLILGTMPGVVAGSAIHVYVASGPRTFRLLAAAVLLPIGLWLLRRPNPLPREAAVPPRTTTRARPVMVRGGTATSRGSGLGRRSSHSPMGSSTAAASRRKVRGPEAT